MLVLLSWEDNHDCGAMTVDIPRSQIMAFNVRLRLPSHATKVGIHVATALKDSQVAQRKEFWSCAPRTCTCKMVGIDIARKERSFRDQRIFLRTFSTSANSSMVKMIFWRNSVHWQFLLAWSCSLCPNIFFESPWEFSLQNRVCSVQISLCPNIIFDGMTSTMIGFTESSSASTVVPSQMVRRPDSNNLKSFNLQIGCRIDLKHLTKRLLWWKPHQGTKWICCKQLRYSAAIWSTGELIRIVDFFARSV